MENEDMQKGFDDLMEGFSSMHDKITELQEEKKRLEHGVEKFSDSLDEIINISGDMNDEVNLKIVISTLILKLCQINWKYIQNPIHFIYQVNNAMKEHLDNEMSKIDRTVLKKEKT